MAKGRASHVKKTRPAAAATTNRNNAPVLVPTQQPLPDDSTQPMPVAQAFENVADAQSGVPGTMSAIPTRPLELPNSSEGNGTNASSELSLPSPFNSVASPLGAHIPQTLKDKIWNNEFVPFNKLLPQEPRSENQNQLVFEEGVFVLKPKHAEKKIANFLQWLDAFLVYASIYVQKHPSQAIPLLRYISTMKKGASNHNLGWIDYDVQFRLKKSVDSSLSWGSIDSELWLFYMQPGQGQKSLQTNSTYNKQYQLKCYDFNYQGYCQKQNCKYFHQCIKCHASHPMLYCHKTPAQLSARNSQARSNPNNSGFNSFRNQQHQNSGQQHNR
jgi:hypothetical protein